MKYYMAPLEGITGYIFRSTYHKYFGGMDKYFTPFISPNQKKICRTREKKDILPENNKGMYVVPQILTNRAELFVDTVNYLKEYGYHEVNLNLGCPVGTVVSKKKGAGFLSEKDALNEFLNEIFASCDIKISVKTRIGMECAEEFDELIEIFNQFPIYELIIHPRTRDDYYKNKPNLEAFSYGYENSSSKICYNGDIFKKNDYEIILQTFPELESVMIGRGILRYPGLIDYIKNETTMEKNQFRSFHDELYEKYKENLYGDNTVLFKMKELWSYMINAFDCDLKSEKKIKKAQRLSDYEGAVRELFSKFELTSL